MKTIVLLITIAAASLCWGENIQTNCTKSGNDIDCVSKTVKTQEEKNLEGFRAGQAIGEDIGNAIRARRAAKRTAKSINTYCVGHPGGNWQFNGRDGYCPTNDEQVTAQYLSLETRHHEYDAKNLDNMKIICDYMETQSYDVNSSKGWDKAYKELKKQGHLHLYAKGSY